MRVIAQVEGHPATARTVNVTFQPTSSTWPFPVPEPVLPTGLTVVSNATSYSNVNGREYRGGDLDADISAQRVVFRATHFSWFQIRSPAQDIWFIGCDIGPMRPFHPTIASDFGAAPTARRIVFEGCHFHGMHQNVITDHTEGLQVGGVDTLIIRNCRFEDNHVMDVMLRCWVPEPIRYVLIEDNFLGVVRDASGGQSNYSVLVAGVDSVNPSDVVIRRNVHESEMSVHPNAQRIQVYDNTYQPVKG